MKILSKQPWSPSGAFTFGGCLRVAFPESLAVGACIRSAMCQQDHVLPHCFTEVFCVTSCVSEQKASTLSVLWSRCCVSVFSAFLALLQKFNVCSDFKMPLISRMMDGISLRARIVFLMSRTRVFDNFGAI